MGIIFAPALDRTRHIKIFYLPYKHVCAIKELYYLPVAPYKYRM